jgi:hypothetical protein
MEIIEDKCSNCSEVEVLDPVQRLCWNCWCIIGEAHEVQDAALNEEE